MILEIIYFNDLFDLSIHCDDHVTNSCLLDLTIIAKYNEAKEIIANMISLDYNIACVDISSPELDDYDDEYIITIQGGDRSLWCEKFKRDNEYFYDESAVTYVLNNCSAKLLPYIVGGVAYEVEINDNVNDKTKCQNHCDCCDCPEYDDSGINDMGTYHLTLHMDFSEAEKELDKFIEKMQDKFDWRKLLWI